MSLGPMEIGLIVLVIVLLFGAKKLPDLARSMGRSMRIFKSEVNEMQSEDTQRSQAQAQLNQKQSDEEFWNRPDMQPGQQSNTNTQQ
ncbi:Sec-independent protein translocase subunit TatA [Corynebacterium tuberculostearicum]|uniref:Sec-independent protein translocase subunit TatA n=1 Tax=Corynebacterium tuberculostearicum TaxID=38304 RepID=UPI002026F2F4|nr:Sec-independent protein translocase subunit TatA [Corynebacterium tuberculostearicum]MCG7463446.1 Sec-independent protein translocase subunit TatA [Corynebacterium tuberculostearicum]